MLLNSGLNDELTPFSQEMIDREEDEEDSCKGTPDTHPYPLGGKRKTNRSDQDGTQDTERKENINEISSSRLPDDQSLYIREGKPLVFLVKACPCAEKQVIFPKIKPVGL